ncbi:hypothetical protein IE81DRAFT_321842 [Ceraceosorus guamensis]|uniref:Uncharacterized protein n=1 Tax=Ceraceosorus guamensis TaxID=1522189 RepID=A0A316W483_9BASI|nr:hypothetical protein IE81DRAFT_321842 [Ceraceosorus guamensis]PWN43928.1 hypothetical protein IE81DRAFT_321842 [Ceraceosorus guamensis]
MYGYMKAWMLQHIISGLSYQWIVPKGATTARARSLLSSSIKCALSSACYLQTDDSCERRGRDAPSS